MLLHTKPLTLTLLIALYLLTLEVARHALDTTWPARFLPADD